MTRERREREHWERNPAYQIISDDVLNKWHQQEIAALENKFKSLAAIPFTTKINILASLTETDALWQTLKSFEKQTNEGAIKKVYAGVIWNNKIYKSKEEFAKDLLDNYPDLFWPDWHKLPRTEIIFKICNCQGRHGTDYTIKRISWPVRRLKPKEF
jgi:hypothetical protein